MKSLKQPLLSPEMLDVPMTAVNADVQRSLIEEMHPSPRSSKDLFQKLEDYIMRKDRDNLRLAIEQEQSTVINVKNYDGGTLLHSALQHGEYGIACDLVDIVLSVAHYSV